MVCKKKGKDERKEEGWTKYRRNWVKKKSGGGPPDLSGAVSRDGCPRLKVLQVPSKKNACSTPTNVCRMKIHINGYVRIMFQRGELSLDCILECVFFKDRSYQVKKERRDRRPSCLMNHELVWHHGSPYVR